MGQDNGRFAPALERFEDVQQEGVVAVFGRGDAVLLETAELIISHIHPIQPRLVREGGIGDGEIERLRPSGSPQRWGLERVLPRQISAEGRSWRNIFIRASAQVALSISCP
jgi:hypothetical protein